MVNKALAKELHSKIKDNTLIVADIPKYLAVIKDVAAESDDILDEIEGWNKSIQFKVRGKLDAWIAFRNGDVTVTMGKKENADVTLEMDEPAAIGLFTGRVDGTSAYMAGALKITGPLPDAVKFNQLLQILRDELDDA